MSVAELVEDRMKQALKELMLAKPINKISVREITDSCKISRHTFYNHFRDMYDLLGYLYRTEVIDDLYRFCHTATWKQAVLLVLNYTCENRRICLNTFYSMGRVHLETFLRTTFLQVIEPIVEELAAPYGLDEAVQLDCASFYTDMVVGVFTAWLQRGMKESPEEMLERIERMMEGVLSFVVGKLSRQQRRGDPSSSDFRNR